MLLPRVIRYDPYTKTKVIDGEPEEEKVETIVPDVVSVLVEEPKKTTKKSSKKKETKDETT